MKNISAYFPVIMMIAIISSSSEIARAQFTYINPLPGSKYHNRETTLAIKNGSLIDESTVQKRGWIEINGSSSGAHQWSARLSDDGKTIIVKPEILFDFSETVSVNIHSTLKKKSGEKIQGKTFLFQIRDKITPEEIQNDKKAALAAYLEEMGYSSSQQNNRDLVDDSVPAYTISTNNNAAAGQIFYGNQFDFDPSNTNCFTTIIENDGSVVYAKDMGINGRDFKINFNGYLTYFEFTSNYWMVMDSNYNIIDSFAAGNGYFYGTNAHDVSMYPDGHIFLLIDDKQTMDLTQYGGKPDASVTTVIIQELDANKDVVWEWSGWDYFEIDDADSHLSITGYVVDYVHANAVSRDDDGNVLLSSRSLCELTKINHETGEFIWRMGGENNQFTFVNDNIPEHFSFQHDLRRIDNGNITLFNNGNYLPVQRSSAKEYELDEANLIATLVWYYEHPDINGVPVYGPAMGSTQRLPNGNTIISWGATSMLMERPNMTEVNVEKDITWEMTFDEYGQKAYRVHKYIWNPCAPVNSATVEVKVSAVSAKVDWQPVKDAVSYEIRYRKVGVLEWKRKNTTNTSKNIINLTANKSYQYQIRTYCANGYVSDWTPKEIFNTLPARFISAESSIISGLEIYPNPVNGIFTLSFVLNQEQQAVISIYDIAGKLLLTREQSFSTGEQQWKTDISSFPSGYYFVELITSIEKQTLRMVKQ